MTPETAAKHRVLKGYLGAWFPILGTRHGRIAVIDGFAGPGRYTTGEEGSPLLMLRTLLEHTAFERITAEVVFAFIEADPSRAKHLRGELSAIALPANVKVDVIEGAYHNVVDAILDKIEGAGKELAPTFAFVDPFGYDATRLELTSRILGFRRCEVLLYVPLPFIARFLNASTVPEEALTNLFGDERWRSAQGQANQEATERKLHDLLTERLLESCEYVRAFEIVGSGPNNGATLFFGTSSKTGLARMKSAMWKIDPVAGRTFRDSTREGQMPLFTEEPNLRMLEELLRRRFGTGVFSIEEAIDFTLVETPYLHDSHLKKATLAVAEREGRLEVVASRSQGRRRGTFAPRTRMRFVP